MEDKKNVTQVRHQITQRHLAVAKLLKINAGLVPTIKDIKKVSPLSLPIGILEELDKNDQGGDKVRSTEFKDKNKDLRKIINPTNPDSVDLTFTEYDIHGQFRYIGGENKNTTYRNAERLIRHATTGRIFATLDHYEGFEEIARF